MLSLYPHYLSDQWPMGTWDDQDTLIITFPEHNCSEWNYNDSYVTFKPSNGELYILSYASITDVFVQ